MRGRQLGAARWRISHDASRPDAFGAGLDGRAGSISLAGACRVFLNSGYFRRASASRTTGRAGLRRATSSKPASSYKVLTPNHDDWAAGSAAVSIG